MKKFFAVLMALVLVLSMGTVALAGDSTTPTTGSITISNALKGETYHAYRIFDLESFSGTNYSYKLSEKWAGFEADEYFTINDAGYVEWHKSLENDAADVKAFAELAKAHLKNVAADATVTPAADGAATMSDLALGYYLVDTSLGSICSLTTTDVDAEITDKNSMPTITKEVKEDSTNEYGETNDADIGQKVEFKATITVGTGAQNYVVHDTMSEGLTFNNDVAIEGFTKDTDYTVTTGCLCGCTFKIDFTEAGDAKVAEKTTIVVTYSATLNESAVIAGEGNPNEVYLSYGDAQKTEEDKTITYTYQFQLVKTDEDEKVIPGAKFKLYDAETGGKEIPVVKESEGVYRVAVEGEAGVAIEAGYVTIKGLDTATYYLEEIEAPAGYNKLTARKEVTINAANNNATVNDVTYVSGGVQVINKTGSLLPETGGIGTTIFYVVGLALMLGAAILLITKKRMTAKAE